jgi:DNA helicase-2/ATP-dependent DNA helicase PcrA
MSKELLEHEFCELRDIIIERHFEHLNIEQRMAVLNHNKNLLLVACPGSGKTTVLVNRLIYLTKFGEVYKKHEAPEDLSLSDIESLKAFIGGDKNNENITGRLQYLLTYRAVNPGNIIVITFTKAAAQNMKQRYEKMNKSKRLPFFGTFHGLFYKILLKSLGAVKILEPSDAYKLIFNTLTQYLDDISEDKVKEVLNKISLLKSSGSSLENFDSGMDKNIFIGCYNNYEGYKTEKRLMDFDDLQINCKKLFLEKPEVLDFYRRGFKYMLVDEFQDCDILQIQLLTLLNEKNSIFAVGDEDQCIYGFRGSRPDCMVDFNSYFKDSNKLELSTNYRSHENVISSALNLIENNKVRYKKSMIASKNNSKLIRVSGCIDESCEGDEISLEIQKLQGIGSYNYRDSAVLYRTNMESRSIIDAFIRKKVPFRLLDKQYNFFEHFISKDIIAYLKLSIDKTDRDSFLKIINKPFRYVSKIALDKLKSNPIKEDCFEFIKSLESTPVFQIKSLDTLRKDIHNLNKMSLSGAINYIITDLGYHDYIVQYSSKFKTDVSELEEILEEFKQAASEFNTIITFLVHVEKVKEELQKNSKKQNEDSVILSTIHGVKGMEFKNVFIINCNEENIPHVNSLPDNEEEERRLFYVGITRTIDNLFLFIPRRIRGKLKEPSRFIDECKFQIQPLETEFMVGDKVLHNTFGEGEVININNKEIDIKFNEDIIRKFDIFVVYNNRLLKKVV